MISISIRITENSASYIIQTGREMNESELNASHGTKVLSVTGTGDLVMSKEIHHIKLV